ncbi:MAG TPA: amidohydrolase family protein, partial [Kofleriaceae bacterium]|nr:amidohydrolase family protein [Kofleriaceae bacterium]
MDFDLIIRHGTVVDGTGRKRFRADVGIRGGQVAEIGELGAAQAAETIDARDRVVSPGFVDIHTHYDAQIVWDRMLSVSPWHGITTVVMGNCGYSVAPTRGDHRHFILRTLAKVEGMSIDALEAGLGERWEFESFPEYLDAIERRGVAVNVAAYIGHSPVRTVVMGEQSTERTATADEVDQMKVIVREAMEAGALGFATSKSLTHVGFGDRPVPSRAADLAELKALASVLGDMGAGVLQATIGPGLFFAELADLARATRRPVTWTALLASMLGRGSHKMMLQQTADQARQGLTIVPQVSCRPISFDFHFGEPYGFESLPLFKQVSAADTPGKMKIFEDAAFRKSLREACKSQMSGPFHDPWARMWVSWCPQDPALEERTLAEVSAERGVDPVDFMLDLALASELRARFRLALSNWDEDEVAEILPDPNTVLCVSDAGAHASQTCDACYSTHLLGRWVRERRAFELEEAIRMLTSRPADVVGLRDRGRLAVGAPADVV